MKHYRVKYGYGKDEFYSIDETELPKALRAQVNGTVFMCAEGTIAGNSIMAIQPDYNRLLGYKRDYELRGEDYDELPRGTKHEYMSFLEETKQTALGGNDYKRLT